MIVNTASKCKFTYQFEQLQSLYEKWKDKDFEILGFPCNQFDEQEPGTASEASEFCRLNYNVSFPILEKVYVNGEKEHPLFRYLKQQAPFKGFNESDITQKLLKLKLESNYLHWVVGDAIKWNFTKFLIDKEGGVVHRFKPFEEPKTFKEEIEKLIAV